MNVYFSVRIECYPQGDPFKNATGLSFKSNASIVLSRRKT